MPYRNAKWAKLVSNFAHFADQFRPICFLVGQKDIKVWDKKTERFVDIKTYLGGHKDIKDLGQKGKKIIFCMNLYVISSNPKSLYVFLS